MSVSSQQKQTSLQRPSPMKDPPNRTKYNEGNFLSWAALAAKHAITPSKISNGNTLHGNHQPESHQEPSPISHYRPIRRGVADFSVVYDITRQTISIDEFYDALSDFMPTGTCLGTKHHIENGHKLIEIVCDSENTCTSLIQSPLNIGDAVLAPVRALDQEAEVKYIKLTNLPYLPLLELEQGLHNILSSYGTVIDILLYTEKRGFFLGSGMAVINVTNYNNGTTPFQVLKHNLPYFDKKEFHATWKSMPKFCRYCHSETHLRAHCPNRVTRSCWNCGENGHFSAQCPREKQSNDRKIPRNSREQRSRSSPRESLNDTETDFNELVIQATKNAEQRYQQETPVIQVTTPALSTISSDSSLFPSIQAGNPFAVLATDDVDEDMFEAGEETDNMEEPVAMLIHANNQTEVTHDPGLPDSQNMINPVTPSMIPQSTSPSLIPITKSQHRMNTRSKTHNASQATSSPLTQETMDSPNH